MNFKSLQFALGVCIVTIGTMKSLSAEEGEKSMISLINKKYEEEKNKVKEFNEERKIELILHLGKENEGLRKENEGLRKENEGLRNEFKTLNEKLETERALRLKFQGMFDFTELIKGLVQECYPDWAEPRKNDDYSEAVWELIFLNVEHSRILSIKSYLRKNDLSEKDFIRVVNKYLQLRNTQAHAPLSNKQREMAYPEVLCDTNYQEKVVIAAVLDYAYEVTDDKVKTKDDVVPKWSSLAPTTVLATKNPLAGTILDETNKLRKDMNLLTLWNIKKWPWAPTPDQIEKVLSDNGITSDTDDILAFLVFENAMHILFKDFETARKTLMFLKREYHQTEEKNFVIRWVNNCSLYKGTERSALKIIISNPKSTFIKDVLEYVNSHPNNVNIQHVYKIGTKNKNTGTSNKDENTYFLRLDTLKDLLIVFGKIGRKYAEDNAVQLSVIPESSTYFQNYEEIDIKDLT